MLVIAAGAARTAKSRCMLTFRLLLRVIAGRLEQRETNRRRSVMIAARTDPGADLNRTGET